MPDAKNAPGLDPAQLRERLDGATGPEFWRSLDELGQTEEFQELLAREFKEQLPEDGSGLSRRRFLQLMGASLALAGLNGCSLQPEERIVPYVRQPEHIVPGKPQYYATARPAGAFGRGLLVESHMGRPTKIEGNPEHPASLGATDAFDQASVLEFYDPDRSQVPLRLGKIRSWDAFAGELNTALESQDGLQGAGIRVLMAPTSSPTAEAQLRRFRQRFPRAIVRSWDPAGGDGARSGARAAFGRPAQLRLQLRQAKVLVALESDFLVSGPGAVRYARDFADARRLVDGGHDMSRLYCFESTPTLTGARADHRVPLRPEQLHRFALALASELGVSGVGSVEADAQLRDWAQKVARDLQAHRGEGVVVAGDEAPAELHTLAIAMNAALGNLGRTVLSTDPVELDPADQGAGLAELCEELDRGEVDLLLTIGVNPAYDAPGSLRFGDRMRQAALRMHFGLYNDETARLCQWHLPMSHYLESWGDTRSLDGTVSIVQPLIAPLYNTRSFHQVLESLLGDVAAKDADLVKAHWQEQSPAGGFERRWETWLHEGLVADSSLPHRPMAVSGSAVAAAARALRAASQDSPGLTLLFRADPTVGTGQFANNGWMQECPKPLTKLTWDNAVLLSPATAGEIGVANEDMVVVEAGGRSVEAAAWILPGMAPGCATLHLGYGRRYAGRVADGCGFDFNPLRDADNPFRTTGASITADGGKYRLACTQDHHSMEGRPYVRGGTLEEYHHDPGHLADGHLHVNPKKSLMPGWDYSEGHKWGMAIDLTACTGCNACVVACHSENNTAIVGKDEVHRGREMHWIRIDRYFEGELDDPQIHFQPVMCQHCEQAPCEVVCPVSATVHSDEGLNDMVYNRCVGTRYCSNNCPYKVRRFNYFEYADLETPQLKLMRNPDVTVRTRGVMEKCSYCVQRINSARIEYRAKGEEMPAGTVTTACEQACPSGAISFGDLNNEAEQVVAWKASDLDYNILAELGTRPRTSYLARVSNPNPELERS